MGQLNFYIRNTLLNNVFSDFNINIFNNSDLLENFGYTYMTKYSYYFSIDNEYTENTKNIIKNIQNQLQNTYKNKYNPYLYLTYLNIINYNSADYTYDSTYILKNNSLIIDNYDNKLYYNCNTLNLMSYNYLFENGLNYNDKNHYIYLNIDNEYIKNSIDTLYYDINNINEPSQENYGIASIDTTYFNIDDNNLVLNNDYKYNILMTKNKYEYLYNYCDIIYRKLSYYQNYNNYDDILELRTKSDYSFQVAYSYQDASQEEYIEKYSYNISYSININYKYPKLKLTDRYLGLYNVQIPEDVNTIYIKNINTINLCIDRTDNISNLENKFLNDENNVDEYLRISKETNPNIQSKLNYKINSYKYKTINPALIYINDNTPDTDDNNHGFGPNHTFDSGNDGTMSNIINEGDISHNSGGIIPGTISHNILLENKYIYLDKQLQSTYTFELTPINISLFKNYGLVVEYNNIGNFEITYNNKITTYTYTYTGDTVEDFNEINNISYIYSYTFYYDKKLKILYDNRNIKNTISVNKSLFEKQLNNNSYYILSSKLFNQDDINLLFNNIDSHLENYNNSINSIIKENLLDYDQYLYNIHNSSYYTFCNFSANDEEYHISYELNYPIHSHIITLLNRHNMIYHSSNLYYYNVANNINNEYVPIFNNMPKKYLNDKFFDNLYYNKIITNSEFETCIDNIKNYNKDILYLYELCNYSNNTYNYLDNVNNLKYDSFNELSADDWVSLKLHIIIKDKLHVFFNNSINYNNSFKTDVLNTSNLQSYILSYYDYNSILLDNNDNEENAYMLIDAKYINVDNLIDYLTLYSNNFLCFN